MPTLGSYLNASVLLSPRLQDSELKTQLEKLQATVKAKLTDPNIKVKLDSAEAQSKVKKLQADLLGIANRKVSIDLKTAQAEAKIAAFRAFAEKEGGAAGKSAGDSYIRKMSERIALGKVAIGAGVLAGLAALPVAVAGAGALAGIALGGAVIKATVKSLNKQGKALDAEIARIQKKIAAGTATASDKQALKSMQAERAELNKQLATYTGVTNAAANLKATAIAVFGKAIRPLLGPITAALGQMGTWLKSNQNRFRAFFAAVAPLLKPILAGVLGLVQNALPGLTKMLQRAGPAMNSLANTMRDVVGSNLGSFFAHLAPVLGNSAGAFGGMLKVIAPLLPALAILSGLAAQLLNRYPQLIPVIGAVALSIKGLGIAAQIAGMGFKAALMGSVVGIVLVVALLVIEHWSTVKAMTIRIWNAISAFIKKWWIGLLLLTTGPLGALVGLVIQHWNQISSQTANIWNRIFAFFKGIWGHIENVVTGAVKSVSSWVTTGWNNVANTTHRIWSGIANGITGTWNGIKNGVSSAVSGIKRVVTDGWNSLASTTSRIWRNIGGFIGAGINTGKKGLAVALDWIIDRIDELGAGYNKGLGWIPGIPKFHKIDHVHFAKGGRVPGFAPGSDTVRAMLSPGEFVINPVAAKAVGYDTLHALNKTQPGSHRPSPAGQLLATGGQIVAEAERFNGHPYHWGGGANPSTGWDCSSAVSYWLGSLGVGLPGGFRVPSGQHGPVASQYAHWGQAVPFAQMRAGDLYASNSHVGVVTGPGTGFAARSTATGTGPQRVGPGYNIRRVSNGAGTVPGIPGTGISPAQLKAFHGFDALMASYMSRYLPPAGASDLQVIQRAKGAAGLAAQNRAWQSALRASPFAGAAGLTASKLKAFGDQKYNAYQAQLAAAMWNGVPGGNPNAPLGGAASGSTLANGREIYQYLLSNVMGGNKIAAAGATASIWGESGFNPFAAGTGGRGFFGTTPASDMPDSVFRGGLTTQLPFLVRWLGLHNDWGRIGQVKAGASSVLNAANLWGHLIERFGINDVHSTGVSLATQIMNSAGPQVAHSSGSGPGGGKHLATGGVINEKIVGWGTRTGTPFTLGENGRERVMPERAMHRYEQGDQTAALLGQVIELLKHGNRINQAGNENTVSALTGVGRGVHRTR